MTVAAIYGRKSLFTGKGESIRNQIDACREYAEKRNWNTIEYFDEGFSGKDTDRPGFQSLLKDIEQKKIDHVIFYKLDRISRKMLDILEFIEKTNGFGVGFVSITESFDTTTPLGRAMVHIAATFAQLEREMLQQRVRDNMLRLARTGRWLGGVTPTGYEAKQVQFLDEQDRTKIKYILMEIPKEIEVVKLLFRKYLEYRSLGLVEKYANQFHIRSKNDKAFCKQTIRDILANPVYVKADKKAYEYFKALNMDIASEIHEFNGENGLMVYNKNIVRKGKSNELRKTDQWILSLGNHSGCIESMDWILVQKLLTDRGLKKNKFRNNFTSILSGILFCECGERMKIKHGRMNQIKGCKTIYYVCPSKKEKCGGNLRGDLADQAVFEALGNLSIELETILKKLNYVEEQFVSDRNKKDNAKAKTSSKKTAMKRLLLQLEEDLSEAVRSRILERIAMIDRELNEELMEIQGRNELLIEDFNMIKNKLVSFEHLKDCRIRRRIVHKVLEKVVWRRGFLEVAFKSE